MKTKSLLIVLLLMAILAGAQDEADYSKYNFNIKDCYGVQSYCSEYFDGQEWFFVMSFYEVYYHNMSVGSNGKMEDMDHYHKFTNDIPLYKWTPMNTLVFNNKLYLMYYNPYHPTSAGALGYARINVDGSYEKHYEENLDFHPVHQMSSVDLNDTLYLFFVEESNKQVMYFRGIAKTNSNEIHWLSEFPTVLMDASGDPLVSHGNVAACTYFTPDNKEKIMVAYPGVKNASGKNFVEFYSGDGMDFKYHNHIESSSHYSGDQAAFYVNLEQGSVKGGTTKKYVLQVAYTTEGDIFDGKTENTKDYENIRMYKCELDPNSSWISSSWMNLPQWSDEFVIVPDFMEYYEADGNTQELRKYLYLAYISVIYETETTVLQWDSDLLRLVGHVTEFCPDHLVDELGHLICVVEGPPPFVLNGWTIHELWSGNKYPPSAFIYGEEHDYTVGSNTVYTKTEEASGGFGPLKSSWKRAMSHNNHNSDTDETTMVVTTTVKPPLDSADINGLMVSFFDTPSMRRTQWMLHDYNGDTMNVEHNLFLFNLTEPQLKTIYKPFSEYSKSPNLNDIHSYEARGVNGFPGIENVRQQEVSENIGSGITQNTTITFDTIYSNTTEEVTTVKVGIDAKYKIFEFAVGSEVTIDYTSENHTENKKGYNIQYKNPAPKNFHDTSNVLSYNAQIYIFKTTSSEAYFLPDGFEHSKPMFVTYEVTDISHGAYYEYLDDHAFVEKYSFCSYPNPASDHFSIQYTLPENSEVQLELFNLMGQQQQLLISHPQQKGQHTTDFSVSGLPSGLYFYKLRIDRDVLDGKLMVIH